MTASSRSAARPEGLLNFHGLALVAALLLGLRVLSLYWNNSALFFDEAQYWVWAQEPAFGYFSKPPMLAWLIGAVTTFCGDSEFCVRLASPVTHTATALLIFLIARHLYDARAGFWAGIVYLTLPAVSLSSTLISTDVPLLFFWCLALYALLRLEEENTVGWALVLGVALGGGLLAKYAMAYFLLCAAVYAVVSQGGLLARWKFWLAIAVGLLVFTPNIIWNLQHQFATLGHTGENIGWGGSWFHPLRMLEFIAAQFGVIGPILFAVYLIALYRLWREGTSGAERFLIAFSLPVFLLIAVQALISKAYANWAATAIPAATILVTHLLLTRAPIFWHRLSLTIHGVLFAVIAIAVGFAMPGQLPLAAEKNPFNRFWGVRERAAAIEAALPAGDFTHILASGRRSSATLIYYLRDTAVPVRVWRGGGRPSDHFEMTRAIEDMPAAARREAVFLYAARDRQLPPAMAAKFTEADEFGSTELAGEGTLYLFRLAGWRA